MRTDDAGKSWRTEPFSGGLMEFVNDRSGWCASGRSVWRTLDGGQSWLRVRAPTPATIDLLSAVSESEAWAIADDFRLLLHTTDGGITWERVACPYGELADTSIEGLDFLDARHGWVLGVGQLQTDPTGATLQSRQPVILRTADGGKTFAPARMPWVTIGNVLPYRVHFTTPSEGWIAVGGPSLLHTTDGGRTWVAITPNVDGAKNESGLTDCSFPTRLEGWAVGYGGIALHTSDGGKTWQRVETGAEGVMNAVLWRVAFLDTQHGWAEGQGGRYPDDMDPLQNLGITPTREMSFVLRYASDGKAR